MDAGKTTIVFGVPVPSSDPVFISIVVVHILLGIICVISATVAMLSTKGTGLHILGGKVYFWATLLLFVTVIPLSILRWPHNNHLLALGTFSFLGAYLGRKFAHRKMQGWTRLHTVLMGSSFILLLTAFYVDNGKNLPLWRNLPQAAFWIFPAAVGVPIVLYALLKHPLNKR